MGYQRTVSSKFWEDSKVEEFSPEDRYTMLYLLTNPLTNLCGCYEISMKRMSRDLGYNSDMVAVIIDRLSAASVIKYDRTTSELMLVNWGKYNWNASPKLDKPLIESICKIKSRDLKQAAIATFNALRSIPYPYGIDTVGIPLSITTSITTSNKGCGKRKSHPRCAKCKNLVTEKSDGSGNYFCVECGEISREGLMQE